MAQPKNTYTFSSTKEACSVERIIRENEGSNVIVLSRKAPCPTITIVRGLFCNQLLRDAGHPHIAEVLHGAAKVYVGDLHGIALGLVETKVEAY
jgi:hypothetical protein